MEVIMDLFNGIESLHLKAGVVFSFVTLSTLSIQSLFNKVFPKWKNPIITYDDKYTYRKFLDDY